MTERAGASASNLSLAVGSNLVMSNESLRFERGSMNVLLGPTPSGQDHTDAPDGGARRTDVGSDRRSRRVTGVAVRKRTLGLFRLTLLGLALGIVTGIGAVLFRDLINLLHNVFFAGRFAFDYDAMTPTYSRRQVAGAAASAARDS